MGVVLREIAGDAEEARAGPVDELVAPPAECFQEEEFELGLVVEEPVEIVEALVDDVLVERPLVLDDDRKAVLVDAQGVDPPAVRLSGGVLAGQEGDAEERFEVLLHIGLEGLLQGDGSTLQLLCMRAVDVEDADVAHCFQSRGVSAAFMMSAKSFSGIVRIA